MADERDPDEATSGPSLEPPSLFKRRKKKPAAAPPPAPVEPVAPAEAEEPVVRLEAPAPPPPPAPTPTKKQPVAAAPEPEPVAPEPEPTVVLEQHPEPAPERPERPERPELTGPLDTPREPRAPREPWLLGQPAAVLTGLLVGALIVALTAASLRACTQVKGTSSCGGPGFFLLVAILIVAVLVGATLLRGARVPQPGSTSFLAVGLLSVVALLFLVQSLFEWWMVIVIPVVSMATFALSHWVTTTYIEPEDDASDPALEPERHDVR